MGSEKDIVERLRKYDRYLRGDLNDVLDEAAATIEVLRAEVKAARRAAAYDNDPGDTHHDHEKPGIWDGSGEPCDSCGLFFKWRDARKATDASNALGKEGSDGE